MYRSIFYYLHHFYHCDHLSLISFTVFTLMWFYLSYIKNNLWLLYYIVVIDTWTHPYHTHTNAVRSVCFDSQMTEPHVCQQMLIKPRRDFLHAAQQQLSVIKLWFDHSLSSPIGHLLRRTIPATHNIHNKWNVAVDSQWRSNHLTY